MLFTLMIIVITREKAIPDVKGSNYDFYQDFYNFFPHPIDIRHCGHHNAHLPKPAHPL
ncbi:hypothetical protein MXE40_07610 [Anaerobiospirillum sp. NML02-A-032]|uniref:hypothetical protein n=2 Tax=unclassified Anaerobiospirillum TaxID=2647410 RepID=UPI001FF21074|nr:hypothetical protein [Anaerobiospirillum sp. NML02-A-032]MCK0540355.1 hypothetical protein [Anaerobiospirillum sp. NML02-A-032]